MFEVNHINLGTIRVRSSHTLDFPYKDIVILEMKASCGCSTPRDSKKNKKMIVNYKANDIPQQLLQENRHEYHTVKSITVKYYVENDPEKKERNTIVNFTAHVKQSL